MRHVAQSIHVAPELPQESERTYPHVRFPESNCSVLLGATSSILKDILSERFGLRRDDDKVVVLPPVLFDGERSYADLEFLVYYNAYVAGNLFKGKPIQVVGTPEQCAAMEKFLSSTVFGPNWDDPAVYPLTNQRERNTLRNYSLHFAPKNEQGEIRPLSEYIRFVPFNPTGGASVDLGENGKLLVQTSGILGGKPTAYDIHAYSAAGEADKRHDFQALPVRYDHPVTDEISLPPGTAADINSKKQGYGITCLGNSTGFDPKGTVTSFIAWMGGLGIGIDLSEDALRKMEDAGIGHHDVPLHFLSHCHQDHDGGLLKRMLQGKTINLVTSELVFEEFMTKCEQLLRFQGRDAEINPRLLVNFIKLNPGEDITRESRTGEPVTLRTWYGIHPIPTLGLSIEFRGKVFIHSGDTQWSPEIIDTLLETGVIDEETAVEQRELFFKDGKLNADLLHMDGGAGTIHADPREIYKLAAADEQSRIFLYHLPDTAVPDGIGEIRKIEFGETQVIIPQTPIDQFVSRKALVAEHPYFNGLDDNELNYFMTRLTERTFEPGETIFEEGAEVRPEEGALFVAEGRIGLTFNGAEILAGGCVGDWGILNNEPRRTTVFVKGPESAVCLELSQRDLLYLLERRGDAVALRERTKFVAESSNEFESFFKKYMGRIPPEATKTVLALLSSTSKRVSFEEGEEIFTANSPADDGALLVTGGYCEVHTEVGKPVALLQAGSIVGEMAMIEDGVRSANVTAGAVGAEGILIPAEAFKALVKYYPALRNGLTQVAAERKRQLLIA